MMIMCIDCYVYFGGVFKIEFTFIDRLAANCASHCLMVT